LLDNTAGYTNTAIVVLTDLSKTGAVELSAIVKGAVKEKSITIKGDGAKVPTLTRIAPDEDSDKNDRVLKVSGGAKIIFENIIINGITNNPDYYHGALAIGEAAVSAEENPPISRVTLGNGAVITGKKDGGDGYAIQEKAGPGVFTGLYGELVMELGSKVTGCETSGGSYAYAPVTVAGGTFTMNNGEISQNTINSQNAYGGGVCIGNSTAMHTKFAMNGGEISGNETVCTQVAYGGGVYVFGNYNVSVEFTMDGGKISGNTVTGNSQDAYVIGGGGVALNSYVIFKMKNSEISGNTVRNNYDGDYEYAAAYGGGVFVYDYCEVEMKDSLITGNKVIAKQNAFGGGLFRYGKNGKFNMTNVEISGNKTEADKTYGGGVSLISGYGNQFSEFTMEGGIIYGKPSDNNDLSGNTAQNGAALSLDKAASYDNNITTYSIIPEPQ
jgi:hypothetical protein